MSALLITTGFLVAAFADTLGAWIFASACVLGGAYVWGRWVS